MTKNSIRITSEHKGATPIEKNVIVVDASGNEYEATYPKRAKGLVKKGRARFVDEHTICLACPPAYNEEDNMSEKNTTIEEIKAEAKEAAGKAKEFTKAFEREMQAGEAAGPGKEDVVTEKMLIELLNKMASLAEETSKIAYLRPGIELVDADLDSDAAVAYYEACKETANTVLAAIPQISETISAMDQTVRYLIDCLKKKNG